jgi:hypothetical protein
MSISNRERFKSIARFQTKGELFTADMIWPETLSNWIKQGAPAEMISGELNIWGSRYFQKYFRLNNKTVMYDLKSGWGGGEVPNVGNTISYVPGGLVVPEYESKIICEDDRTITYINAIGQTNKAIKGSYSMPMFVDWPVKDRTTWEKHKKRLDPNTPGRWPSNWDAYVKKLNNQDDPVVLQVGGLYGHLRDWIGSEKILYMFYDDPKLIEDMMEHVMFLEIEIIKRVIKNVKIDEADFWEDMAYKSGSFISPEMVKKYMVPRYKKITGLLRSKGIDIIWVDCDGNIEQLIPLWLESGVNYVWPLEQAAGNDAVALRKKYGNDLIMGGAIDKRELAKGKEAIKKEVMSKVPFLLKKGGYFPSVDHLVPPDIPFENYCYYINLLREIAGLEKILF